LRGPFIDSSLGRCEVAAESTADFPRVTLSICASTRNTGFRVRRVESVLRRVLVVSAAEVRPEFLHRVGPYVPSHLSDPNIGNNAKISLGMRMIRVG
jgi:hypothetical protein